jgi:hypothetical protein
MPDPSSHVLRDRESHPLAHTVLDEQLGDLITAHICVCMLRDDPLRAFLLMRRIMRPELVLLHQLVLELSLVPSLIEHDYFPFSDFAVCPEFHAIKYLIALSLDPSTRSFDGDLHILLRYFAVFDLDTLPVKFPEPCPDIKPPPSFLTVFTRHVLASVQGEKKNSAKEKSGQALILCKLAHSIDGEGF